MKYSYKTSLISILTFTAILLLAYASLMYRLDPLQQFRLSTYQQAYISEIYQNPGIAKHAHYNTVVIGSSLVENFRPSYIEKSLRFPTIKLSISGTNAFEMVMLLETAISTGQVSNVILGLDIFRFAINEKRVGFPTYLYSHDSVQDKIKYLLNIGNIHFLVHVLFNNFLKHNTTELDDAFIQNNEEDYKPEKVIQDFARAVKYGDDSAYSLSNMKNNFNKTILSVIKKNPQIHFYLFFHPYSIYTYKLYEYQGDLLTFLQMKKYIFEQIKSMPNVKLYDFGSDENLSTNLSNYRDIGHYSVEISNFIVRNLVGTKYLVTEKNIDVLLNHLERQTKSYKT